MNVLKRQLPTAHFRILLMSEQNGLLTVKEETNPHDEQSKEVHVYCMIAGTAGEKEKETHTVNCLN